MIKQYNPKIDFRIIKFISYKKRYINKHVFFIKDLFKDLVVPKRKKDKRFILIRDTYYLLKNSKEIDISLLEQCYFKISGKKLSKQKKDKLNRIINKKDWTNTFISLIKNRIFKKNNYIMGVLILNYLRIYSNKLPIAILIYKIKNLIKQCKKNNYKEVSKIFKECEITSIKLNKRHNMITSKMIINKLTKIKDYLINNYNIKHLYLFGSYAIGNSNEYSDLDIYLIVKNKINKIILIKYLEKLFGINIDLAIKEKRTKKYITKAIRKTMIKIF